MQIAKQTAKLVLTLTNKQINKYIGNTVKCFDISILFSIFSMVDFDISYFAHTRSLSPCVVSDRERTCTSTHNLCIQI